MKYLKIGLLLLLGFINAHTVAQTIDPGSIPPELAPWVDWVMYQKEQAQCPFYYNQNKFHICAWPAHLDIRVTKSGGNFEQHWLMMKEGWVDLPGNRLVWPQNIKIAQTDAVIGELNGHPRLYLEKGWHQINGEFQWSEIPKNIAIPKSIGLVKLTINNKKIQFPEVDDKGFLWINQRNKKTTSDKNRLQLKVFRKISDQIPMLVTTIIELDVSGQAREIVLGQSLITADDIAFQLDSKLPARLNAKGRLRVQIRPGHWRIQLVTRKKTLTNTLIMPIPEAHWPTYELWCFEPQQNLRIVTLQAKHEIDPKLSETPSAWHSFKTFKMQGNETFKLIESKRANSSTTPNQLTLERKIWLDFNGKGYTIEDTIQGQMSRQWRLEISAPFILGRATINGVGQLITKSTTTQGVEVRNSHLNMIAESRYNSPSREIPVAWKHEFSKYHAQLNLSPGWKLLTAHGVDEVSTSWVDQWSLQDIFIVFIIAVAFAKLWHIGWGILALITLVLIFHEASGLPIVILNLVAVLALIRILPQGKLMKVANYYRNITLFILILGSTLFIIEQIREGLYPQLEYPYRYNMMDNEASQKHDAVSTRFPGRSIIQQKRKLKQRFEQKMGNNLLNFQFDKQANIQTGPGLPLWTSKQIDLYWNGPVDREQTMRLYLLSPTLNMGLNFIQVPLILMLIFCLMGTKIRKISSKVMPLILLFPLLTFIGTPSESLADIPTPKLLAELSSRMLAPESCLPQCATSSRMLLEIDSETMRMLWEVHSNASTIIPLPGNAKQWLPEWVFVNGEPATGLYRDHTGNLLIPVNKGTHQIFLEGRLPHRSSIPIALPLKPHHIEAHVSGWEIRGLNENGIAKNIQINRLQATEKQPLEQTTLPAFIQVQREISFGLTWQVDTTITRLSAKGTPVVLAVPLLVGESVISETIRVKAQHVQVNMGPNQHQFRWSSVFEKNQTISLQAPQTTDWIEIWKINISPVWHLSHQGITSVNNISQNNEWQPQWRPWPGEKVQLTITRLEAVQGKTRTIEYSKLSITPGHRSELALTLRMRSSHGGKHTLTLPQQSKLLSLSINGKPQTLQQHNNKVTFPLVPGLQTILLKFRQEQGIAMKYRSPQIDLQQASVNSLIQVKFPRRWIFWVSGPQWGPAILFWGIFITLIIASLVLGRITYLPLKGYQWFLFGLGLTQAPLDAMLIILIWFFAMGKRKSLNPESLSRWKFNGYQIVLFGLTLFALSTVLIAIHKGLLGKPEMQIVGVKTINSLTWMTDRVSSMLPQVTIYSLPVWVYQGSMLLWALWLAFTCTDWLKWAWQCFSSAGYWRNNTIEKIAQ